MAQALIVIDIQEGLVKENPYNAKNFISNTKAIIQHFRDQNIEVIFIRHSEDEGLLATGSDNWQVYHELKPQENEKIFNKYYNSIFKDSALKEYLDSKSITDLTFVGMQVEFCIDTSVKVGLSMVIISPSSKMLSQPLTMSIYQPVQSYPFTKKRFGGIDLHS